MLPKNTHPYDFYTNFQNKDNISNSNHIKNLMNSQVTTPKEKLHFFSQQTLKAKINYSPTAKSNFISFQNLHILDNDNQFRPSLMIDLSDTPSKPKKKKTLILDIDETLVHSSFIPFIRTPDISLNLNINGINKIIYVLKRPHVDEFLKELSNIFEIITFTASISQYASPLLDQLDKNKIVNYRLFRQHCKYEKGVYIKELSKIGRPLEDVIIIDNNPMSYVVNIDNGIPILTWYENPKDDELMKLIPLLKYLSKVGDVRHVIRQVVDRKMNRVDFNKVNQIIYGFNNISNKIDFDKDYNSRIIHYKDISNNITNSLSNMSNNEYKKYFGNIDLNSKHNTINTNSRNTNPIVNTIDDFNNLNSNNNNLKIKKINKRKILNNDIKQDKNQNIKSINTSPILKNKEISLKNNIDNIIKNLSNNLNNSNYMSPKQNMEKIYKYINNCAISNNNNNNSKIINNINGNLNISINVNNINNINNNIIDNTLKNNKNINKNISFTEDNINLNNKLNNILDDNLNNNISNNKNSKITTKKLFKKLENNNKEKNNNYKYIIIDNDNDNKNKDINNVIKTDNENIDKNLNNENNNKNNSNKILNKISFNNYLKNNKKNIKNKTIEKNYYPEDTKLISMPYPKNNKVPNDSDNNKRYSITNLKLIKFCNNKKKGNYNSLNNTINTNNNDEKNNLRNDIKIINVKFNNEMIINKKGKSHTPKNDYNMKFLKDKLIPQTEKIKIKERHVKKFTKYINLNEFNKLKIKNNRNNRNINSKIINKTQNLNINIKSLTIDINQIPEKKKDLIQYSRNSSINNMNDKVQNKFFINKNLSIDSINLNIPGRNDNSSENNIKVSRNLIDKKLLNDIELEHKYRPSSPTLNMPMNSDYSKYYIYNVNKKNENRKKKDLNNNNRGNILSRSQDKFKKIETTHVHIPRNKKHLENNTTFQEYKYDKKDSNKSICFPQ